MKILVTGAAGFIGSHLSEHLIRLGHQVSALDNFTDYYCLELKYRNKQDICDKGVNFFTADLVRDDLTEVLEKVEVIYHLAAQPGISASTPFESYLTNNILATRRLLDAASQIKSLKMFINISTSSVYGANATSPETSEPRPTSIYGVTKLAAEQLVLALGRDQNFPACSLRLFSVYGPRERPEKLYPKLIHSIMNNLEFAQYEGSEQHYRSYTFIADAIQGLLSVLNNLQQCQGEIFNIGTDVSISTGDGIHLIEEIIGRKASIRKISKRPGDQLKTQTDITKARRLLNYNPSTGARQGLEKEVEWYMHTIHNKINLYL
jgi:nucleoside-diphosphate-sugar epimerase